MISRFSTNSIVFSKIFQLSLTAKKGRLHLWGTVYFTFNCFPGYLFFLLPCEFQVKIKPSWENYLNRTAGLRWNTVTQIYTPHLIFLSAVAVKQVMCWTGDICSFISYCWNAFNYNIRKLINKQAIFYSPMRFTVLPLISAAPLDIDIEIVASL